MMCFHFFPRNGEPENHKLQQQLRYRLEGRAISTFLTRTFCACSWQHHCPSQSPKGVVMSLQRQERGRISVVRWMCKMAPVPAVTTKVYKSQNWDQQSIEKSWNILKHLSPPVSSRCLASNPRLAKADQADQMSCLWYFVLCSKISAKALTITIRPFSSSFRTVAGSQSLLTTDLSRTAQELRQIIWKERSSTESWNVMRAGVVFDQITEFEDHLSEKPCEERKDCYIHLHSHLSDLAFEGTSTSRSSWRDSKECYQQVSIGKSTNANVP